MDFVSDSFPPIVHRTHFRKVYQLEHLIDPINQIKYRVEQIEHISHQFDFIPETNFEWVDDRLIYHQHRVKKKVLSSNPNKIKHLKQLADDLDQLSSTGFVHGDINRKNIIFDGQRIYLIDLEPSLHRMKHGRPVLLYTPPYISLNDLKNNQLSQDTDKIGFYFLVQKTLDQDFRLPNIMDLIRRRVMEKIELLRVKESELTKWSYDHIFNYLADTNK